MKAHSIQAAVDGDAPVDTGGGDTIPLDIRRWYRRVYALCQARLISRSDAEEATQETFLRGLRRRDELRSSDAVGAWLRAIAHNVCVDTIRRNKVRHCVPSSPQEGLATSADNPARRAESNDEQDRLLRSIHQLPEALRESILLHYYEEMTYDEMASWLGVARSTVNERLSKARSQLRRELLSPSRCHDEV